MGHTWNLNGLATFESACAFPFSLVTSDWPRLHPSPPSLSSARSAPAHFMPALIQTELHWGDQFARLAQTGAAVQAGGRAECASVMCISRPALGMVFLLLGSATKCVAALGGSRGAQERRALGSAQALRTPEIGG